MNPRSTMGLTSECRADGTIVVALSEIDLPALGARDVLIAVEAAPINPSDIGLMFGQAEIARARFAPGRVEAPLPPLELARLAGRVGQTLPLGNEGCGTVIAAGKDAAAQALVGHRVAALASGMYARHRVLPLESCMVLPTGASSEDGAAAFVNPMTAMGFIETLHAVGGKGLVHTAAASNLGQMLVRLCHADGIPLVNVVRTAAQAETLRDLVARHIVNSTAPTFARDLEDALAATGADTLFDAIGGGPLLGTILSAMERVGRGAMAGYSRYGSATRKRAFVYGTLDPGPIVVPRDVGFAWDVSGWLLTPMLEALGQQGRSRLQDRVRHHLTTLFASTYKAHVPLSQVLDESMVRDFTRRATGSKYLIRLDL